MRRFILMVLLTGAAGMAGAQTAVPPAAEATPAAADAAPLAAAVVTTAHYRIESEGGEARAQALGELLEAFLTQFNSFFLFDLEGRGAPFVVKDFASKTSFDAALAEKLTGSRRSFVYLSYRDSSQNALYTYDGHTDELGALGYQSFIQFFWTFVPQPPTWMQYGFAAHFSDFAWDAETKTLTPAGRLPYLELTKSLMLAAPADLTTVLSWNPRTLVGTQNEEALSWSLVHYLMNASGQAGRLLGNLTAALNPSADIATNNQTLLTRLSSYKNPAAFSTELKTYFDGQQGFSDLVSRGIEAHKAGQWAQARQWFTQARAMRAASFLPVYYLGLGAFAQQQWDEAWGLFEEADALSPPEGLVPLALGMTAFEKKDWPEAKRYLEQAGAENPAYISNSEPYLAVVESQLSALPEGR